ncbi:MAG: hypothetical protein ACM3VS_04450 [Candidatus Dadabacteria bacterium]
MKLLSATLVLVLLVASCAKDPITQAKENFVLNAMTNGKWKVSSFVRGSTDVTTGFAPYSFQFKTDLTVDAINNGTVEKTGSWSANSTDLTITSTFTGANATLTQLNGTWKITDNSLTYVKATQTVGGEVWTLRLDKL